MALETQPSSSPITMDQVKEQFAGWRASRSKLCKIPAPLWEAVRHLVHEQGHSLREISATFGINYRQLRRNGVGHQPTSDKSASASASSAVHFMKVDALLPPSLASCVPSMSPTPSHPLGVGPQGGSVSCPTLELTRPDGAVLKASGLSSHDVCAFVQRFLCVS